MRIQRRDAVGSLIGAAALGAGLMYLLDPERGGSRRAKLRDGAGRLGRDAVDAARVAGRDLANRSRGVAAEVAAAVRAAQTVDDRTLEARVRSAIGRVTSHAGSIVTIASGGHVVLSGPVLEREADRLVRKARRVRGVISVEDQLERHASPGESPTLQTDDGNGPGRRSLPPAARLVLGAAGAALAVTGLGRGGRLGRALWWTGSGLVASSFLRGGRSADDGRETEDAELATAAAPATPYAEPSIESGWA